MAAYSLADTNLFAYCRNNPIGYYDVSGFVPTPIADKLVHDNVLSFICNQYPELKWTQTCIRFVDNFGVPTGRWGFCDLYNPTTGEVWELKKDSTSRSCRTVNAKAQLNRYVNNGYLKAHPDLTLRLPYKTSILSKSYSFYSGFFIYHVRYWYEGDGILRYSYTRELNREKVVSVAETLGCSVILILMMICCPGAAPGFVGT